MASGVYARLNAGRQTGQSSSGGNLAI